MELYRKNSRTAPKRGTVTNLLLVVTQSVTGMTLSTAHTSANAADAEKLLLCYRGR